MDKYDIIIGIDPGITGAVAIIENITRSKVSVFDTPTTTEIKVKKKKKMYIKHYDISAMADLLRPYAKKKTIVCIERVGAMTGQGVTSMFSFGRGVGIWEGIFGALELECEKVSPSVWKKEYGDRLIQPKIPKPSILKLTTSEMKKLSKSEIEEISNIKKEYNSSKRRAKENAKDSARFLAVELYPKIESDFKLKKDSDRAEALLIAERKRREIYGERKK